MSARPAHERFGRRTGALAATAALAVTLLSACGSTAGGSSKTYTIRFTSPLAESDPSSQSAIAFGKKVSELTHGQVKVQTYFSSQLGTAQNQLNQTKSGSIQMNLVDFNYIAPFEPAVQAFMLPYLFTTKDQAYKVENGPLGDSLKKVVLQKTGLRILAWAQYGWKNFDNNKRPLNTPDAFKGLKLRTVPSSVGAETLSALGGEPTTMDLSEVYTSIRQGVVDGLDAPDPGVVSGKFYEVAKYITEMHYQFDMAAIFINNNFYTKLPKDLQNAVTKAAQYEQDFDQKAVDKAEAQAQATIKSNGGVVTAVSDAQKAVLKAKLASVYNTVASTNSQAAAWVAQLKAASSAG